MLRRILQIVQRRKKRILIGLAMIMCLVGTAGYFQACRIAKTQFIRELESIHEGTVTVGNTFIGWNSIVVQDVELCSADPVLGSWCRAEKVRVRFSLIDALFQGKIHIDSVVFEEPDFQLAFDDQGQLLNRFSFQADDGGDLNFELVNGKCSIAQQGKQEVRITNVQILYSRINDRIEIVGGMENLLGAFCRVNFSGDSTGGILNLSVDDLSTNSTDLAQTPLIPIEAFSSYQFDGGCCGNARIHFQGSAVDDFEVRIRPDIKSLEIDTIQGRFKRISSGEITITPAKIGIEEMRVDCLGGSVLVSGNIHRTVDQFDGSFDIQAQSVDMAEITRMLELTYEMQGNASFAAELELKVDQQSYQLDGWAKGSASDFSIERMPCGKVDAEVILDKIKYGLAGNRNPPSVSGHIRVNAKNRHVDMSRFVSALGQRYQVPVPTVTGGAIANVCVLVPMNPVNPTDYFSADIRVESDQLDIAEIPFRKTRAEMTLFPERNVIRSAELVSSKNEEVKLAGTLFFETADRLRFNLKAATLDASLLSNYFDAPSVPVFGCLNLAGKLTATRLSDGTIETNGSGDVACQQLQVDGLIADRLSADVSIDGNVLGFRDIQGKVLDGEFHGEANLEVTDKRLAARGNVDGMDLSRLLDVVPIIDQESQVSGLLSGSFDGQIDLNQLKSLNAHGSANVTRFSIDGHEIDRADMRLLLNHQTLTAEHVEFAMDPRKSLATYDVDLPEELEIEGRLNGQCAIQFLPFDIRADGRIQISENSNRPLSDGNIHISFAANRQLLNLKTEPDGSDLLPLELDAIIPFDDLANAKISGRLNQFDLARIIPIETGETYSKFGLSGMIDADFEVANFANWDSINGSIEFGGLAATLSRTRINNISGSYQFSGNDAELELSAKPFGGNAKIYSQHRIGQWLDAREKISVEVSIDQANLGEFAQVFKSTLDSYRPDGAISLNGKLMLEPSTFQIHHAQGQLQLQNTRIKDQDFVRSLKSKFDFDTGRLELKDLRASLGSGVIQGKLRWPLVGKKAGKLDLRLSQVDLSELGLLFPDMPVELKGLSSGSIQGKIVKTNRDWRLAGAAHLSIRDGQWDDIPWELRNGAFQWSFEPARNRGEVSARQADLNVLAGKLSSDVAISWGDRTRFSLQAKVKGIDTRRFSDSRWARQVFGEQGTLDGDLRLKSNNFRSLRDLNGSFDGSMNRIQALQLPVLRSLSQYVNQSQFKNRRFEQGRIRLVLQNSKIRVQQFSFADQLIQVLVEGDVRLNGRLDLSAIVHVGQNNDDPIIRILKSPLLASTSPPAALIAQFDRLLSDRLLFFKITGSFQRPRVQMETAKVLRQETLKFILEKTYNLSGQPNSLLNRSSIRLR